MKTIAIALVFAGSFAAGCASSASLASRGSVIVSSDVVKAFAPGPAVVHAFTMDRGGGVYTALAIKGTDADCVPSSNHGRATSLRVDQRNVVEVAAGQVVCVFTGGDHRLELLWHVQAGARPADRGAMLQASR